MYFISKFILNNIEYSYERLDYENFNFALSLPIQKKFMEIGCWRDIAKVTQVIRGISKQYNFCDEFTNKLLRDYQTLLKNGTIGENGKGIHLLNYFQESPIEPQYEGGILRRGVCEQIAIFCKDVCEEVDIPCKVVYGNTGLRHAWNLINVNGKNLHYDYTYAMYCKDKRFGWDKYTTPQDWLGMTEQQLLSISPRKIEKYM